VQAARAIDPITVEVIRHGLIAAADEMKINLMRTAYNTVIYEVLDFSVGLFDRSGQMISQTSGLPIFLGNLGEAVRCLLRDVGEESLRPGDVYLSNDSYAVGTHLNDVTAMSPIMVDGEPAAFAVSRAHWIDVGGRDPGGWFSDTTEIYQEGIRLRSIQAYAAGEPVPSIMRLLELNVRYADSIMGDLRAQVAAGRTGEERYLELAERYGHPTVLAAIDEIQRQAEQETRDALRAIPDGVYQAESFMDDDGVAVDSPAVRVTVRIEGDAMEIDLEGSSEQVRGPINVGLPATVSACRVALKCVCSPLSPVAEGSFAPLTVRVPANCMFNAQPPAPCAVWIVSITLIDTVFRALADVLPTQIPAAQYGDVAAVFMFGVDPRSDEPYLIVEPEGGGWGAFSHRDGESVLIAIADGDTRNIPVEILEAKYPLRIARYEVRPDSGGPGRHRGGLGHFRDIEVVGHQGAITATMERSKCPPWGLGGGEAGETNVIVVNPDGDEPRTYQKTSALPLAPGDIVSVRTGGGGGYGPPTERDPAAVLSDVREGYVSVDAAASDYGIVIDRDTLALDREASAELRRRMKGG
jgi:N-methylhydantoinase B